MDPKTLEALQESIRHWKVMAKTGWEREKPLSGQCALCRLFLYRDCAGCPVNAAGHRGCLATPYDDAYFHYDDGNRSGFRSAARLEVKFLKSLLPKDLRKKGGKRMKKQ